MTLPLFQCTQQQTDRDFFRDYDLYEGNCVFCSEPVYYHPSFRPYHEHGYYPACHRCWFERNVNPTGMIKLESPCHSV